MSISDIKKLVLKEVHMQLRESEIEKLKEENKRKDELIQKETREREQRDLALAKLHAENDSLKRFIATSQHIPVDVYEEQKKNNSKTQVFTSTANSQVSDEICPAHAAKPNSCSDEYCQFYHPMISQTAASGGVTNTTSTTATSAISTTSSHGTVVSFKNSDDNLHILEKKWLTKTVEKSFVVMTTSRCPISVEAINDRFKGFRGFVKATCPSKQYRFRESVFFHFSSAEAMTDFHRRYDRKMINSSSQQRWKLKFADTYNDPNDIFYEGIRDYVAAGSHVEKLSGQRYILVDELSKELIRRMEIPTYLSLMDVLALVPFVYLTKTKNNGRVTFALTRSMHCAQHLIAETPCKREVCTICLQKKDPFFTLYKYCMHNDKYAVKMGFRS